MAAKIHWGLLSTASINNALIGPIRQAPRSNLVAVASRNWEKAQAYAKEKEIPHAYGNYEAMLADPEVDVIYNSLPNPLHCEWTVKAALAGKHVLCEKPLVISLAEMDEIETAAMANNVIVFEAFANLHHPQTLEAKKMVQADKLGDLQMINGWQVRLPPDNPGDFRLKPEMGGGSLWDVGVYPVGLATVIADSGAPLEVWASQIIGDTGVEVAITGQMRFSNGVVAQISSGFRSPSRRGLHIVGSQGVLEIRETTMPLGTEEKDFHIHYSSRDSGEETIVIPATDAYQCEVEAMEACILDDEPPVVPLCLSRDILRSVLALYQSANTGELVKFP